MLCSRGSSLPALLSILTGSARGYHSVFVVAVVGAVTAGSGGTGGTGIPLCGAPCSVVVAACTGALNTGSGGIGGGEMLSRGAPWGPLPGARLVVRRSATDVVPSVLDPPLLV